MPTLIDAPAAHQKNRLRSAEVVETNSANLWSSPILRGWAIRSLDTGAMAICLISTHPLLGSIPTTAGALLKVTLSVGMIVALLGWLALSQTVFTLFGVYRIHRAPSFHRHAFCGFLTITTCILTLPLVQYATSSSVDSLARGFFSILLMMILFFGIRVALLSFASSIRPHLRARKHLLIVGTGQRAIDVYAELKENPYINYTLMGYVDSDPQTQHVPTDHVIGAIEDLESILMHHVIDEVVIALPMKSQYDSISNVIAICERLGIQSQYFTHHFGTKVTKQRRLTGATRGRIALEAVHRDARCHLKRLIDVIGSMAALLLFSPLLLITAFLIKVSSKGPIIFTQERFGLNKRTFQMFKFRSMVVDAETYQWQLEHLNETSGPAFKIANDPRITRIGRLIRKTSIDELPQLVNVLLGQMSLVGPRPLPTRDVSRFSEAWLMRRFSVKPGLTCLWQVMGRSNTDFDRWIELDLEYIDSWSLLLDWQILFKTVPAVLKGRGAS